MILNTEELNKEKDIKYKKRDLNSLLRKIKENAIKINELDKESGILKRH